MRMQNFFIIEVSYPGNVGAMEVFRFYQKASREEKDLFDTLLTNKKYREAWDLVQNVTGITLHPMGDK